MSSADRPTPAEGDVEALRETIDSLPEAEKVVMTLTEYEGLTDAEIASVLTESEATVAALHESALERLAAAVGAPPTKPTDPLDSVVKDGLENKLHDLVCSGAMTLRAAQLGIARNWQALYKTVFGTAPGG